MNYTVNSNQTNKTSICIHEDVCLNQNKCACQTSIKKVKNCKYLRIEMCNILKQYDHIIPVTKKLRKTIYAYKNLTNIKELLSIRVGSVSTISRVYN